MRDPVHPRAPIVVAADMGYGHLRAAHPIAEVLGVPVERADAPPLADPLERSIFAGARLFHQTTSRASAIGLVGGAARLAMDLVTRIPPLDPGRNLSSPTLATRYLDLLARSGAGRGLAERASDGAPLVTTFYATAILAERAGCERVFSVVTDTDCNRIWVAADPARSRIVYIAPTDRVVSRLRSYGVDAERIERAGFPLPPARLGGDSMPVLRRELAARLARLDASHRFRDANGTDVERLLGTALPAGPPEPPLLAFVVGGAGAQSGLVRRALGGFRDALDEGRLRLALVAGVHAAVAERFERWIRAQGLRGVRVLFDPDLESYFRRFDDLLAETDVMWTKPSELTFFAGLGIPLLLAQPIGDQERCNRRFALDTGIAVDAPEPSQAGALIEELLADGTLARAAWNGFLNLPQDGAYRIAEFVRGGT